MAWKVGAFPPSGHAFCISEAASTVWLKYPLYSGPPYFLSIWCSDAESAPWPPSLAFSAWSSADFLVICSRMLSAAAPWDLSKLFEKEGKNYKHSLILPVVSPGPSYGHLCSMSIPFKKNSDLLSVTISVGVSNSEENRLLWSTQVLKQPLFLSLKIKT